ncbi:PREDICTED: claw keratin-like isoform X1 [Charadrius vociferus]|uniref:claw keratin-like isoform X1 n=1 Tax=Charadrius vociferus TaxID=50402 RepID=UPI0005214F3C|nr:PREDICTED: claw keratin-like isoform X1 [Charadrius vociferus]
MSCSSLCIPSCGVAAPAPLADTANEPCVRQCPDSTVVIQPPASVVTFPGPILSSFPQYSVVGSAGAPGVGGGYGGTFGGRGGFGGFGGYGVYGGLGGSGGYGGLWGLAGPGGWGRLGSCGYGGWRRGHRYLSGNCGPC